MHSANMSYMYHCLLLSTEVSNIKKVCARSLLVKICLVKMCIFVVISSSTLVVYTLIILDTLRVKISTKHESEQTLGNKLYPLWLPSFGIIFLLI